MAKKQRGSTRTSTRSATPPPSSGKSTGQKSSGSWTPNRVSSTTKKKGGPNRTLLVTIGAVVVGLLIVGVVILNQPKAATSTTDLVTPGNTTPPTIPADGRTLGNANAPATVDIYGDFRCSACYYFTEMGTEDQLIKNEVATGQAKIVWHDFLTIDQDGSNASRDAANAAWCAADQGKFWTMHDWLYANQSPTEAPSAFTQERLLAIGKAAGMDMTTFEPCVKNGTHNQAIVDEMKAAPKEVSGTPSVFVNGQIVGQNGQVPTYAQISAAITAATGSSPAASPAASASPGAS
jgi:protein-disulfide isomerase